MKNSFNLLGVFKDVKIAVAGSTRSVHPSDALDLNKFRKSDSIDEGKDFKVLKGKCSSKHAIDSYLTLEPQSSFCI